MRVLLDWGSFDFELKKFKVLHSVVYNHLNGLVESVLNFSLLSYSTRTFL